MAGSPIVLRDGQYETRIHPLPRARSESWWWCVTHTVTKAQRSGRSSREMYARADARKALGALQREAGEVAAA